MKFGVSITKTELDSLENRAHRIAGIVDQATAKSPDRHIRDISGQLVDRILEWLEEIKEQIEIGDEDALESVRNFQVRLSLAEKAISTWPRQTRARSNVRKRRRARAA